MLFFVTSSPTENRVPKKTAETYLTSAHIYSDILALMHQNIFMSGICHFQFPYPLSESLFPSRDSSQEKEVGRKKNNEEVIGEDLWPNVCCYLMFKTILLACTIWLCDGANTLDGAEERKQRAVQMLILVLQR